MMHSRDEINLGARNYFRATGLARDYRTDDCDDRSNAKGYVGVGVVEGSVRPNLYK